MNEDKYNQFIDGTLQEIGEFLTAELNYETEFVAKSAAMPLSTLIVSIPKDDEGRERYLSLMVQPADIEGYKVTFMQLHMIFSLEVNDDNRMKLETLVGRFNEMFLLGSFTMFFDAVCMKYALAFDREDGVDLLDLVRSIAVFIWQADTFGAPLDRLARGEIGVQEAVQMVAGAQ